MSQRHADIWSHLGHYLADPYIWPWSPNGHSHGHEWPTSTSFVQCQSALPFWDNGYPWSRPCVWSKVKVTFEALSSIDMFAFSCRGNQAIFGWDIANYIFENSRSRSWPRSNPMVTFEVLSSIDIAFRFVAIGLCWLRYSKFHIWHWKFKVKIIAKVKVDGHI